ncbi:hypothetical protein [Phyllobacterium leguminum]|uniref:Uncharacterized protein n=1 Tax=Phyllobacterium leguminum TaxID=314237 RepID=A0A318T8M1_9HYPH|nr:hypothetical protein [Phyllobacterium leguminum]PYE89738.1 hypothetical protein C7477_103247 [Phyllobacterium leguminum]
MAGIDRECLLREILVIDRQVQELKIAMRECVVLLKDTNRELAEGRERIEKTKKALSAKGYSFSGPSI